MTCMIRRDIIKGLVIKKIPYKEYHEIVYAITENGTKESFFYENVNKNKKKEKLSVPCIVTINYLKSHSSNKIINLEVDEYYKNIIYDITTSSYVYNILELVYYYENIEKKDYELVSDLIKNIDCKNYDEVLSNIYFIIYFLKKEGFIFKYLKTKNDYKGYDFAKNMFVDYKLSHSQFYALEAKYIKLIYILSINDVSILEKIHIDKHYLSKILEFLNLIMKEYLGIETKTFKKIRELDILFNAFREDN